MTSALVFSAMARTLHNECHALRLAAPSLRTGPRSGCRTFRVREDGSAVVAVSITSRPDAAVAWDLAAGVCVVNRIEGWPSVVVASALASEALDGALSERTAEALRSARPFRYPEHV